MMTCLRRLLVNCRLSSYVSPALAFFLLICRCAEVCGRGTWSNQSDVVNLPFCRTSRFPQYQWVAVSVVGFFLPHSIWYGGWVHGQGSASLIRSCMLHVRLAFMCVSVLNAHDGSISVMLLSQYTAVRIWSPSSLILYGGKNSVGV